MSHVRRACSMTEKINIDCKNAFWRLLVHSTVVELNGQPLNMERDTGASVSLISQTTKNNSLFHSCLS